MFCSMPAELSARTPAHSATPYATRLSKLAARSDWLMAALRAVRSLGLESWCIGAGAVRALVWNHLHGFSVEQHVSDVDVVFFDSADCSPAYENRLQCVLKQAIPELDWEVVNQAAVHHRLRPGSNRTVPALRSLAEGVASWLEYATCVGVFLENDDTLHVIAPHGLDDLFNMVVRWNPTRAPAAAYRKRVEQKRFTERWPRVEVVVVEDAF